MMTDLRRRALLELADRIGDWAAGCAVWAPEISAAYAEATITLRMLAEWPTAVPDPQPVA